MIGHITTFCLTLAALGLPQASAQALLLLVAISVFAASRPRAKARIATTYDRAFAWIDQSITAWRAEGRLAICIFLRLPFGSIARAIYVLAHMALTHVHLAASRIDYITFRSHMSIHSPLVLLLTCFPGFETFAYLASKPIRMHHLLARVALDAVILKLPRNIYQRSGFRTTLARPVSGQQTMTAGASNGPNQLSTCVPSRLSSCSCSH